MNMKRSLVSFTVLGALTGFGASYGATSTTFAAIASQAPSDVAAEAEKIETEGSAAYAGWFFGLGLSYQYTKGEVLVSDTIGERTGAQNIHSLHDVSFLKSNVGKVGGSIVSGYGGFVTGNCYLGGEVDVDITGSKKREREDILKNGFVPYGIARLKTRGIVPTVSARVGWYVPVLDSLVYTRIGLTFLNNQYEIQSTHSSLTYSRTSSGSQKVSPIVGIGIETTCLGNYGVRLEGDYRFAANKTVEYGAELAAMYKWDGSIKNKVRGYVVRLVCVYRF